MHGCGRRRGCHDAACRRVADDDRTRNPFAECPRDLTAPAEPDSFRHRHRAALDTGESAADEGHGEPGWTRRVSSLDEVRDGGYGVGSAATFEDRAMPLGHPVKAWEDTKTFVDESHPAYDEAEPHVWFADAEAAQRAGFRPVD